LAAGCGIGRFAGDVSVDTAEGPLGPTKAELRAALDRIRPGWFTVRSIGNDQQRVGDSWRRAGIVVDRRGLVVTPAGRFSVGESLQVVANGAVRPAVVLSTDPGTLAVLRIDEENTIPPAEFADETLVGTGDLVFALCGADSVDDSISIAVVSDKNHRLADGATVLQVDSAIGPGFAPGFLVDCDGRLLGVIPQGRGVSYAIPAARVQAALKNWR
jgi:S1-C subfamily serine protease